MKKKIALIFIIMIIINLVACSSGSKKTDLAEGIESQNNATAKSTVMNNSDINNNVANKIEESNEKDTDKIIDTNKIEADKKLLTNAGWGISSDFSLGLYVPKNYIDYSEDTMAHDDNVKYLEYGINDYDYRMIYDVYYRFNCDMYFTKENMEFAQAEYMNDEEYDIRMVRETDNLFIYEAYKYHVIFVFVKDSNEYYRIRISDEAWEDFKHYDTDTDEILQVKAGEIFTEDRYNAFINTIQWLGNVTEKNITYSINNFIGTWEGNENNIKISLNKDGSIYYCSDDNVDATFYLDGLSSDNTKLTTSWEVDQGITSTVTLELLNENTLVVDWNSYVNTYTRK